MGLSRLRTDENFCDIELYSTEGVENLTPVLAHRYRQTAEGERELVTRNVLAAATNYFHAMFTSGLIESGVERASRGGRNKYRQKVVLQGIQQQTLEVNNLRLNIEDCFTVILRMSPETCYY